MNERLSQHIILVEALLFLLPLSLLSVWYAQLWIRLYHYAGLNEVSFDLGIISLFAAIAIQALAWVVIARFMIGGRRALVDLSDRLFAVLSASSVVVVAGVLKTAAYSMNIPLPDLGFGQLLDIAIWGTPALIPFSHIAIERHCAQRDVA
jgi:hypothetical protein